MHDARNIDASTRKALDVFVTRLSARFPLHEAILFGSRARGDARPDSDADVAVVLNGAPADFLDTKLAMADIAFDTMLDTGTRIQPLPVWTDQWRQPGTWMNPELLHEIARTGIRL